MAVFGEAKVLKMQVQGLELKVKQAEGRVV